MSARFLVLAVGPLSNANIPVIDGLESFRGAVYHTAHWPHQDVDFTGQRVGIIGTGSSGIQAIPCIAEQARQLYVFQRSANYSVPAGNVPLDDDTRRAQKAGYAERRRLSMASGGGSPHQPHPTAGAGGIRAGATAQPTRNVGSSAVCCSVRRFPIRCSTWPPTTPPESSGRRRYGLSSTIPRSRNRSIPTDHPIGTKRICTDDNYFQTFNRDNVTLVNLRLTPIQRMDAAGVVTSAAHYDLDALVLATGFDAMTGSVDKLTSSVEAVKR